MTDGRSWWPPDRTTSTPAMTNPASVSSRPMIENTTSRNLPVVDSPEATRRAAPKRTRTLAIWSRSPSLRTTRPSVPVTDTPAMNVKIPPAAEISAATLDSPAAVGVLSPASATSPHHPAWRRTLTFIPTRRVEPTTSRITTTNVTPVIHLASLCCPRVRVTGAAGGGTSGSRCSTLDSAMSTPSADSPVTPRRYTSSGPARVVGQCRQPTGELLCGHRIAALGHDVQRHRSRAADVGEPHGVLREHLSAAVRTAARR